MGPDLYGMNSTVMVTSTNPPLQTDKRHALLRQGNTDFMEIYFGSLDRTQPKLTRSGQNIRPNKTTTSG